MAQHGAERADPSPRCPEKKRPPNCGRRNIPYPDLWALLPPSRASLNRSKNGWAVAEEGGPELDM